jgi:hypothetical protein
MAKTASRKKVEECVIEYAKQLDPDTLPLAYSWYNKDKKRWCYNHEKHVGVMFAEQLQTVSSNKGGLVLIVLPVCATMYLYFNHKPIPNNHLRIASTYV